MGTARALVEQFALPLAAAFAAGFVLIPIAAIFVLGNRAELEQGEPPWWYLIFGLSLFGIVGGGAFSPWSPLWLRLFSISLETIVLGMLFSYFTFSGLARLFRRNPPDDTDR
ncbi:hypothetical protein [Neotabrizicola sp. sgz301269]|uniref:hypothetical protein n=1 Tax=Neotabrizicola sp. sgz301269 TaxID=3276282 RepID=UPI003770710B